MERTDSFKMTSSFPPDYFDLAQIPTDQREHEYHLSAQTRSLDDESLLQISASQPYDPWQSSENWAALRSNLASESMTPLQHPGHNNSTLEPHEQSPSSSSSSRVIVPDSNNTHLSSFSTPHHHSTPMAQSNLRAPRLHHGEGLLDWQSDLVTSSFYTRDVFYRQPAQLETSSGNLLGNSLALQGPPPSPPISISSQQSSSISVNSMGPTVPNTVADSSSPRTSLGDHSEGDLNADLPYSKLIFRALKEAEGNKLTLQQIYEWFTKNTNKGKDNTKGWQNSIRHNLSMNKGFTADKAEGSTGKKPQNLWALTQDALDRGYVESTTRYRKANYRKAVGSNTPVLKRQWSGSKGGKAANHAAKVGHPSQRARRERHHYSPGQHQPQQAPQPQPSGEEHYLPTPPLASIQHYHLSHALNGLPMETRDSPLQHEYDYSHVIGCTSPPLGDNVLFCDAADPGLDYIPLDMGHLCCWYGLQGPSNGLTAGPDGSSDLQH